MLISGVKLIEMPINGAGRYFLPDDRVLAGKKIQSIVSLYNVKPLTGDSLGTADLSDMYIHLTCDGQKYIYNNSLFAMCNGVVLGKMDELNTTLSLPNCFIEVNKNYISGVLQLVVFYEDTSIINSTRNINSNYDTFVADFGNQWNVKYYLGDNRLLVDKRFRNLMTNYAFDSFDVATGFFSPIEGCTYITLVRGSNIIWDKMPVLLLNQFFYYKKYQFANFNFDFNNSYITVAPGNELPEENKITFTAEYER